MNPDRLTHPEFRRLLPQARATRGGIHSVFHLPLALRSFATLAAVVMNDGTVFLGEARCSPRDTWNRRLGFRIAVGRALAEVAGDAPCFVAFDLSTPESRTPAAVRHFLRDLVSERGEEMIEFLDAAAEERQLLRRAEGREDD